MEHLPVTLILTNEEIDRLLQLLDLLRDPDARHLQERIYGQQEPLDTPPFSIPLTDTKLSLESTTRPLTEK